MNNDQEKEPTIRRKKSLKEKHLARYVDRLGKASERLTKLDGEDSQKVSLESALVRTMGKQTADNILKTGIPEAGVDAHGFDYDAIWRAALEAKICSEKISLCIEMMIISGRISDIISMGKEDFLETFFSMMPYLKRQIMSLDAANNYLLIHETERRLCKPEEDVIRIVTEKLLDYRNNLHTKMQKGRQRGGNKRGEFYSEIKEKAESVLSEYLKENPNVSITAARDRVSETFGISRRTLEKYTSGIKKKKV